MVGLTTALALSKHAHLSITVVSKHTPGDYDIEYASPWAGANYLPVGKPGSPLQRFETATWPELDRICREVPEAGIHYQNTVIYNRKKDVDTATGRWFKELVKEDAWFRKVVPDVRAPPLHHRLVMCVGEAAISRSSVFAVVPSTGPHVTSCKRPKSRANPPSSASSPNPTSPPTATQAPPSHPSASTPPSTSRGS